MDVSTAGMARHQHTTPTQSTGGVGASADAQASRRTADESKRAKYQPPPQRPPATAVVVAWHAASLGYVTRIVDRLSGTVVMQTPPEEVLDMVERVVQKLRGRWW